MDAHNVDGGIPGLLLGDLSSTDHLMAALVASPDPIFIARMVRGPEGELTELVLAARPTSGHGYPVALDGRVRRPIGTILIPSDMAMTLRTDEELDSALAALSEAEGASRQEIIRRAVLERYERNAHSLRAQESSSRMIDRWADVLERLGTV